MSDALLNRLAETFDSFTITGNNIRVTTDYEMTPQKSACIQTLLGHGYSVSYVTRRKQYTVQQLEKEANKPLSQRILGRIW